MGISGIGTDSLSRYGGYSGYNYAYSAPSVEAGAASQAGAAQTAAATVAGPAGVSEYAAAAQSGASSAAGKASGTVDIKALKRSGAVECQTCKSRTYQDVSSDSGVSFKAPGHIDPASSAAVVMSHEQEHVSNAKASAASSGGRILSQSVRLHTSVCPECGRVYVSGGETRTVIISDAGRKMSLAAYRNASAGSSGKHVNVTV